LAAVDMHTAQHLVTECLGGNLAHNRTIILVTHHLTLCLPVASFVLELESGKTLYQGTIPELEDKEILSKILEAEEEPFIEAESQPEKPANDADDLETENGMKTKSGVLIEAEARAEGEVSWKTYFTYFKAGGIYLWVLVIGIQFTIRVINVVYQVNILSRRLVALS